MTRGKQTCRILKEIRRQIAEANDIEYAMSECRYKGDCSGACPRCEAEVRYLEQQLHARRLAGKAVALAGISLGALSMLAPMSAAAQMPPTRPELVGNGITITRQVKRGIVKGRVSASEPAAGATVHNLNTDKSVCADADGNFEIEAGAGDSLTFSYADNDVRTITITNISKFLEVSLYKVIILEDIVCGEADDIPTIIAEPEEKKIASDESSAHD